MIVWEGPSAYDGSPIVAIITGLERPSTNRKTGPMAQLWILRRDISPLDALATDGDAGICGGCPLRGWLAWGQRRGRACYVNVGQAPTSIWRTYWSGGYAYATPQEASEALAGHRIRLGAYGDPAMLPLEVCQALIANADGWTGYTHQWRTLPKPWAHILMASADTVHDRQDARAAGWRSFYVVPVGTDLDAVEHAVECAATREHNKLQCHDCLMCAGTRHTDRVGVDVVIHAHGAGAKHVVH